MNNINKVSAFENSFFFGPRNQSPGKVLDKTKISETYKNNSYRIYNDRGPFAHNNDFFSDKEDNQRFFMPKNREFFDDEEAFIRAGERGIFILLNFQNFLKKKKKV